MRREWIEIEQHNADTKPTHRLPPCGGSGLKWDRGQGSERETVSPSMRREWIEMRCTKVKIEQGHKVSLHAEGVD